MRGSIIFGLFALLVQILLPAENALAQVTTATISGEVRDATGAVLPGASITIKNLETGMTRTLVSDEQGRYRAPNLPVGSYEIRAELAGFKAEVRSGIKLTVGREAAVDLVLEVGEITEMIQVAGEAPLVDTAKSEVSGLIDDKKIRDLPLNGRTFSQLALLEPNVNAFQHNRPGFFGGRTPKITVSGARHYQNSFLLDGTDVNDVYNNTPGSVAGVFLGVETVREFRVMTHNMSAEYGRSMGGVINAVTKSGTNQLHGSAYEFHRNSALDARNFFDAQEPPPFKRNQFGFTLGGPIKREKTFFFGAYEGLRERLSLTKVGLVPNQAARRGDLGPINPDALPFVNAYPLPNGRDFGRGVAEHVFVFKQPADEDFFQVRIDHSFSERDSFFARYTFDNATTRKLAHDLPVFFEPERSRRQYLTIEEQHVFSPAVLNTFRYGFNRSFDTTRDVPFEGATLPPRILPFLEFRTIIVGGLTRLGTDFRLPITDALNLFEWSDDVAISKGAHSLKFGFNIKRFHYNILQDCCQAIYIFPSVVQLIQGRPVAFQGQFPGSDVFRSLRQSMFAFYGQDDVKLTANFTLNLGLRYEFVTVPTEKFGRLVAWLGPFDPFNTTVKPPFRNPSLRNFAPRIGFAWDPFGRQKTSLRAGFGIFYDPVISYHFRPPLNLQYPRWPTFERVAPPFPDPLAGVDRNSAAFATYTMDYFINNPYMLHYNLSVQHELFSDTVFTIGYIGSRGINLPGLKDGNSAIPQLSGGRVFFPAGSQRRNPRYGFMRVTIYDNNSFYNSLALSLNRRFSHGLQFQASYTLSKSIDDASQQNTSDAIGTLDGRMLPENRKLDRGLSNHDIRHNLVFNYTYDLPFGKTATSPLARLVGGWQLNGITTITSGNPFTVYLAVNQSRSLVVGSAGVFLDRPNLKPGRSNNPISPRNPIQYFDPSAFDFPEAGFLGTLGRNTLIGPGVVNFDFSLVKNTRLERLGEEGNIQFRVEFFNLFNRANFGLPANAVFGAGGAPIGSAGRITSTTTTARQIQFALKLMF